MFGVALLAFLPCQAASGQGGLIEFLRLDRLQAVSVGVTGGMLRASQLDPTKVFGVSADYGEIAPGWRVLFGISFWDSHYEGEVVQTFVDSLQKSVSDPSGTAHVKASPVSLYDVTFGMGFRRHLRPSGRWTPFVTMGLAAHVLNAEGPLIKGTFVERSLDNIAAGLFGELGLQTRFFRSMQVEAGLRGDLLSGYRSTQLRTGLSYYFGDPRRPATPSTGMRTR